MTTDTLQTEATDGPWMAIAWMYSHERVEQAVVSLIRCTEMYPTGRGWIETPLYAHPPTTNPVDDRETPVGDHQMVTQADRDAAADVLHDNLGWYRAAPVRAGEMDNDSVVQSFARHRLATRAQVEGENHRLREALWWISVSKTTDGPIAEIRKFARQALAAGEHRKDGERQRLLQDKTSWPHSMTQDQIESSIDALCGCGGKCACSCVSVINEARRSAWQAFNERFNP